MAEIAVIDSDKRQIDIETFRNELGEFSADRLTLERGNIDAPIDPDYDLSQYRAIYLRVGKVTAGVLDRTENLEIVSTCGSGYDHIDVEAATERGVLVTHTPNAPAPGAVEHTFGFMFTLLNDFPEMFERTANSQWSEGQEVVQELHDRTIGVVGLGTIGSKVARIAENAFNADVIAYDPYVSGEKQSNIYPRVPRDEIESDGITLVGWKEVFQSASVVTMHVPLTPETKRMVGYEELEALEDEYFINLSRGSVVDEEALRDVVQRGNIGGVALDVMETEPPDPANPLLKAPNVYITPHIAGGKEGYPTRSARTNANRIKRALNSENPQHVINPNAKVSK